MKPKLTEHSERKFVVEFNPALIFCLAAPLRKISAGSNSHSDLCSLTFHKSRAHWR